MKNNNYILNEIINELVINEFENNNSLFAKKLNISRQFIGNIRNKKIVLGITSFLSILNKLDKNIKITLY